MHRQEYATGSGQDSIQDSNQDLARKRVLVVEDDARAAHALRLMLRHWGFAVEMSTTLGDAMLMLRHHRPDVVLLDLMLPDGDGARLLEHMHGQKMAGRVLVMTGLDDEAQLAKAMSLEPMGVLHKPVDLVRLMEQLDRVAK